MAFWDASRRFPISYDGDALLTAAIKPSNRPLNRPMLPGLVSPKGHLLQLYPGPYVRRTYHVPRSPMHAIIVSAGRQKQETRDKETHKHWSTAVRICGSYHAVQGVTWVSQSPGRTTSNLDTISIPQRLPSMVTGGHQQVKDTRAR